MPHNFPVISLALSLEGTGDPANCAGRSGAIVATLTNRQENLMFTFPERIAVSA
jgi:hypothetical protein